MTEKRYDVVTFGEAMLRLSPPDFQRLEQASSFNVVVGGGEMNVAVAVARLGLRSAFVTRVPATPLGRMIINKTREHGVDASHIIVSQDTGHGRDRTGLYFAEFGAKPRASSVLYDRHNSAIANIRPGEVDWESILAETRLFHLSGITPAISKNAALVTVETLQAAKKAGALVSFDLNFRVKLWSGEEAGKCLAPLMQYVDILITTEEDTNRVFGISGDDYHQIAIDLNKRFGLNVVTITLRDTPSVWINNWAAIAYHGGQFYGDVTYEGLEMVDRIGSGDSYAAGFICGYLTGEGDIQRAVRYGNALSALKHSIPGDLNWSTLDEVEKLIKSGPGNMRISR